MRICGSYKHRYYISLDGGSTYTELTLIKRPTIKITREKDQWFFRRKTDEWKFMYFENKTVYAALLVLLASLDTISDKILVKIDCYEDFSTYDYTEFAGIMVLSGLSINEDTGMVAFTPEPNDDYAWYDEFKDQKVIVSPGTLNELTYDIYPRKYRIFNTTGHPPTEYALLSEPPDAFAVGKYYGLHSWEMGFEYDVLGQPQGMGWCTGTDSKVYRWIYGTGLPTLSTSNMAPVTGADWATYWQEEVTYFAYGQIQIDFPSSGFTQGNGIYDTNFPEITGTATPGATNCRYEQYWKKSGTITPITGNDLTRTGIKLVTSGHSHGGSVISTLLYATGLTLSVVSEFFTNATNPITGTTSRTDNIYLSNIANVKDYDASRYDIIGEMTLSEFFKFIATEWNCYWYMSGTDVIIEHLKYFQNGYSYSGSQSVGVDLTNQTTYPLKYQTIYDRAGGSAAKSYSFMGGEYFQWEEFIYKVGGGTPGIIEYTSKIVKPGKKQERDLRMFTCDLQLILVAPETVDEDGWFIACCDSSKVLLVRDTIVQTTIIGLPTYNIIIPNIINGDLYFFNLLNDWHTYGRQLASGEINGQAATFDSVIQLRKQTEIRFPRLAAFDPMDLVTTELGNGFTESAELSTETDFIKIVLLYE